MTQRSRTLKITVLDTIVQTVLSDLAPDVLQRAQAWWPWWLQGVVPTALHPALPSDTPHFHIQLVEKTPWELPQVRRNPCAVRTCAGGATHPRGAAPRVPKRGGGTGKSAPISEHHAEGTIKQPLAATSSASHVETFVTVAATWVLLSK